MHRGNARRLETSDERPRFHKIRLPNGVAACLQTAVVCGSCRCGDDALQPVSSRAALIPFPLPRRPAARLFDAEPASGCGLGGLQAEVLKQHCTQLLRWGL
jgi:hypothetical protein